MKFLRFRTQRPLRIRYVRPGLPLLLAGLFMPLHGQTVRIMPLGDSITRGTNDINFPNGDIPGGYRRKLGELLAAESTALDFIGDFSDNAAAGMDPDHNGANGWRNDEILAGLPNFLAKPADHVLLLAGTNDILQGVPVATAAVNLENLIIQITSMRPTVRLHVATIPPITQAWNNQSAAALNASANAYNTEVRNRVAAQAAAGRRVSLVDLNASIVLTGATPAENFYQPGDGIHPGQAGYDQLGARWFDAVFPTLGTTVALSDGLPAAPAGLNAVVASPSRINLAWTDASADEAAHHVWSRNTAGGIWQRIAVLPADATSYVINGVRNGVESRAFAVCAVNASGASAWSNVVTTPMPADKAHLKNASASASFNASFAPSKGNDGLLTTLWASTGTASHFWQVDLSSAHHIQRVQVVTRQDVDLEIHRRNFDVRVSNDPAFATYTSLGGQGASPLPFKGTLTLEIPQTLPFRYLRVAKTDGQSFALALVRVWGVQGVPAPAAPLSFSALAADSSLVRLRWTAASTQESGFKIERRSGSSAFLPVATLPAGETSFIDGDLTASTSYTYRVRAFNEAGESANTPEVPVNTAAVPAYDLWAAAYPAFAALPAAQRLPAADPDGDGTPNLLAHAFAMNPLAPDAARMPALVRQPGPGAPRLFFRHIRNLNSPSLFYQIQSAVSPAGPWSAVSGEAAVSTPLPGFPDLESVSIPLFPEPGESRRFYRLWVLAEEQSQ